MSKQLSCRPSQLYHLHDELAAFCFDRAITIFGTSLEADITRATKDAKPDQQDRLAKAVVKSWMTGERKRVGQFRDPNKHMSF